MKGWLELAERVKDKDEFKRKLKGELEANEREKQQIDKQMTDLAIRKAELSKKARKLCVQIELIGEIGVLQSEINSIALLGKKEEEAVAKVEEKMKQPYFMDALDLGDVSTLFSMFEMDGMFTKFKEHEESQSIEAVLLHPAVELAKKWQLKIPETMKMLFKLKLIENGEKEAKSHVRKCSICQSTDVTTLLGEHGMKDEEKKEIREKIRDWKGYFLVAAEPMSVASTLFLPTTLKSKFIVCLGRIQKAHSWNAPV